MYPSKKEPSYGTFVKNQVRILEDAGFNIDLRVMHKVKGKLVKGLYYIWHYLRIVLTLLTRNYDVVYIHYASLNAMPVVISKKLKKNIRIMVNVHGSDVLPENPTQEKINFLTGKLLKVSDLVVVPSKYYQEVVKNKYNITEDRIFVSPSGGVDHTVFKHNAQLPNTLNIKKEFTYIGFVSRIDVNKGWDDALKAFSLLKKEQNTEHIKLIMVGNGKEAAPRNELIKDLNLKNEVVLYDFLSHAQLVEIYNSIEVFLFPTKREAESLGLVGLEAMACAVPVIGSKIGGLQSYIEDGKNGFLFEPGNYKELYKKIKTYWSLSENKRQEMSLYALETAKRFDANKVKEDFIIFIKNYFK